ncbi:MAG: RnfABCDGE type electron transport complex subunit D [Bdellovibrionales bacterium]|nr:RnfABCDGE type electron transport complex subunit D [Bdellovibrionales bacterium]
MISLTAAINNGYWARMNLHARAQRALADPRHYQIAILTALLLYGLTRLRFGFDAFAGATAMLGCLGTQALWCRCRAQAFEPRSALISGLSLALLFRGTSLWWVALAALLTISSKFVLRCNGKHVFNPTNFGIATLLLLSDSVWVSPGQWGSGALLIALVACFGVVVVRRATRSDITWAFLFFHSGLILLRGLHLGDPYPLMLHQLTSGSLLIFTFFMISDPRSTPNARLGRIVFAGLVAVVAHVLRFYYYEPNALFYALLLVSMGTPSIDRLLPDERYLWPQTARDIEVVAGITTRAPAAVI